MRVPEGYFAIFFREPESKTIGVTFPDHPGIITYGKNWGDAKKKAKEALTAALETDFDRDTELPAATRRPKVKRGQKVILVRIPPEVRPAYLLRGWRRAAGYTQKEMAQKLEISYQAYQRMERPGRSNLTVATLQRIADALKQELVLELRASRYDEVA